MGEAAVLVRDRMPAEHRRLMAPLIEATRGSAGVACSEEDDAS
jgi:hypothetical protein